MKEQDGERRRDHCAAEYSCGDACHRHRGAPGAATLAMAKPAQKEVALRAAAVAMRTTQVVILESNARDRQRAAKASPLLSSIASS
jgi:gamma-glutamyl phosphate reductase